MGKSFVQPLIYLSDERYEHTLPYIKGAVFVFSSRRSKTRLCKLYIFAMQATAKCIWEAGLEPILAKRPAG